MNILKAIFSGRRAKTENSESTPPQIVPTHFRKEEFDFGSFQDLSSQEAVQKIEQDAQIQILDVRFEYEFESHHIPGAVLIPLPQLPDRFRELDQNKPTLVVCEHGMRSIRACTFLSSLGFKTLYNLTGGMSTFYGKQEGNNSQH